jgi:hypothetical protein
VPHSWQVPTSLPTLRRVSDLAAKLHLKPAAISYITAILPIRVFRHYMESTKWIRTCFSKIFMRNAYGSTRFGVLARDVFSWDPAIGWTALEDPGRQLQWTGRNNLG